MSKVNFNNMRNKLILLKSATVFVFGVLMINPVSGQYVVDTVAPIQNNIPVSYPVEQPAPLNSSGHRYYQWDTPILEKVDVRSIEMHKNDHERYLSQIEILENVLKKNKKELNSFFQQAKDQAKALNNEKKNLNDKRKFYKQDEKLSNKEKKLRDRELKLIQKERKTFKKQAKDMSSFDVDERLRQFDDREYRIEIAEGRWSEKREVTQRNLEKLADDEKILNERDFEIKERLRDLDYFRRDLDLQTKQLALEKKQTKLEIKKAKAALKQQNK